MKKLTFADESVKKGQIRKTLLERKENLTAKKECSIAAGKKHSLIQSDLIRSDFARRLTAPI